MHVWAVDCVTTDGSKALGIFFVLYEAKVYVNWLRDCGHTDVKLWDMFGSPTPAGRGESAK